MTSQAALQALQALAKQQKIPFTTPKHMTEETVMHKLTTVY